MRIRSGVEQAALSDTGCQRENNEDRCSYWEPASDEQFQKKGRLAMVADGMGGYEGGQEASRIATEVVQQVYAETAGDPQTALLAAFQAAHRRIQDEAELHPELHGMGTTCTAAVLMDSQVHYAHVGDSRLYFLRGNFMSRLTRDHSYVSRLVENGVIRPEEAELHPQRHILTAALGAGASISPDLSQPPIALEDGDTLLLCTDGLWSQVTDSELQAAMATSDLDQACRDLVEAAKKHGGPDNITVQILRLSKPASAGKSK